MALAVRRISAPESGGEFSRYATDGESRWIFGASNGTYVSLDDTATWAKVNLPLTYARYLFGAGRIIAVQDGYPAYVSEDDGQTWTASSQNITASTVPYAPWGVFAMGQWEGFFYAAGYSVAGTVYRTANGINWDPVPIQGLPSTDSLRVDWIALSATKQVQVALTFKDGSGNWRTGVAVVEGSNLVYKDTAPLTGSTNQSIRTAGSASAILVSTSSGTSDAGNVVQRTYFFNGSGFEAVADFFSQDSIPSITFKDSSGNLAALAVVPPKGTTKTRLMRRGIDGVWSLSAELDSDLDWQGYYSPAVTMMAPLGTSVLISSAKALFKTEDGQLLNNMSAPAGVLGSDLVTTAKQIVFISRSTGEVFELGEPPVGPFTTQYIDGRDKYGNGFMQGRALSYGDYGLWVSDYECLVEKDQVFTDIPVQSYQPGHDGVYYVAQDDARTLYRALPPQMNPELIGNAIANCYVYRMVRVPAGFYLYANDQVQRKEGVWFSADAQSWSYLSSQQPNEFVTWQGTVLGIGNTDIQQFTPAGASVLFSDGDYYPRGAAEFQGNLYLALYSRMEGRVEVYRWTNGQKQLVAYTNKVDSNNCPLLITDQYIVMASRNGYLYSADGATWTWIDFDPAEKIMQGWNGVDRFARNGQDGLWLLYYGSFNGYRILRLYINRTAPIIPAFWTGFFKAYELTGNAPGVGSASGSGADGKDGASDLPVMQA